MITLIDLILMLQAAENIILYVALNPGHVRLMKPYLNNTGTMIRYDLTLESMQAICKLTEVRFEFFVIS